MHHSVVKVLGQQPAIAKEPERPPGYYHVISFEVAGQHHSLRIHTENYLSI